MSKGENREISKNPQGGITVCRMRHTMYVLQSKNGNTLIKKLTTNNQELLLIRPCFIESSFNEVYDIYIVLDNVEEVSKIVTRWIRETTLDIAHVTITSERIFEWIARLRMNAWIQLVNLTPGIRLGHLETSPEKRNTGWHVLILPYSVQYYNSNRMERDRSAYPRAIRTRADIPRL